MRQRFFKNTTRKLFGTNLLQMNPQTIRSLCKSSKFHFSINSHLQNSTILDQITNLITQNKKQVISSNKVNNELDMDEEINLLEEIEFINNNLRNVRLSEIMDLKCSVGEMQRPGINITRY